MLGATTAFRISQHNLQIELGIYSRNLQLSSFRAKPPSGRLFVPPYSYRQWMFSSSITDFRPPIGCFQPNSPFGIFFDSSSGREDILEISSERSSPLAGGIVALGKFDALHIGHRELAIQASRFGVPFLLSFKGIAKVLGWESRPPIVAKCDRKRILSLWASYCGNVVPKEFELEFSSVRHLTPRDFVEKLSKQLGVFGVVAGENYRFGYKASGDASELIKLCKEFGLEAHIIKSVMDTNNVLIDSFSSKEMGQVSSTRVRRALAKGDIKYVSSLLGRQHRLMVFLGESQNMSTPNVSLGESQNQFPASKAGFRDSQNQFSASKMDLGESENQFSASKTGLGESRYRFLARQTGLGESRYGFSVPKSGFLNVAPKDGFYGNCNLWIGEKMQRVLLCRVSIDATHIHLESDVPVDLQGIRVFGIEFSETKI